MKVLMVKHHGGILAPATEEAAAMMQKVENGDHEVSITLKQNSKLHRKVFGFFAFCTRYYYGDVEASKDEYKTAFVRKYLTICAGYSKAVYNRDGSKFEVVALSISYDNMEPEERAKFYSRIVDAALKRVFDKTTDDNILNQLRDWF
tara:strand:- start:265 stop:705 length:441 start_codon:yes stop_codon:yes gene_type:complete